MNRRPTAFLVLLLFSQLLQTSHLHAAGVTTGSPKSWTDAELRAYSKREQVLHPDKPDLYAQVIKLCGRPQNSYSVDLIRAAAEGDASKPFDYKRASDVRDRKARRFDANGNPPPGAYTPARAKEQLSEWEALHPGTHGLWKVLHDKYQELAWYEPAEIEDVETNGAKPKPEKRERPKTDPLWIAADKARLARKARVAEHPFVSGFRTPQIRQSWRDVLYDEDPSQTDNTHQLSDLVGASFSYVRDFHGNSDTWSSVGSIIFPWTIGFAAGSPKTPWWAPVRIAVAPSLSVNRVDTNGDPKKELDSLVTRLGIYGDWSYAGGSLPTFGVEVRAAGVYVTDTGGHGGLPGGELDIEPRWNGPLPIGYSMILAQKEPGSLKDKSDTALVDTQLRVWLHVEGGDVQDTGKSWDPALGNFLRLGPAAQFQIRFTRVPPFNKDASITVFYNYLASVLGSDVHNSFLKVTASYTLFKDVQLNHKVSLTADYQRGGTNFTKEDVHVLTLGIGVLF